MASTSSSVNSSEFFGVLIGFSLLFLLCSVFPLFLSLLLGSLDRSFCGFISDSSPSISNSLSKLTVAEASDGFSTCLFKFV